MSDPNYYSGKILVESADWDFKDARIRELEALLRELIDIEGPQPGHVEWYTKCKLALAEHE